MYDIQLFSSLIVIGVLIYSAMIHGLVYYRLGYRREHCAFALLCVMFALYAATNIFALYMTANLQTYIVTSKLSTVFVIFAAVSLAWFATEFLHDNHNIPLKPIILSLVPFFVLDLAMTNGILWSSIDGIELKPRSFGANVMQPINPVISWPMYGLWTVIAGIYILMTRAAYLSLKKRPPQRGLLLLSGIVLLSAGFVFDMLIDFGINHSYVYISEFVVLIFVVLMSLHLSDELRLYELNLETLVKDRTHALEQANKELETFSYSVSHDLRAPLRAIKGFTAILEEDYIQSLDSNAKMFMGKISNNVTRMEKMINGLLELSRISQGPLHRNDINISDMASQIIKQLKTQYPDRDVTVDIQSGLHARGDPILVRVVLQNLLGNAWKFTSKNQSATITVRHYLSDNGKQGFVVSDNGAGFNPKYTDKIFLPFQRLHNEEDFSGTGIGLATVNRIIKRHGGKIWAEGQENEGASFYFTLE
ncbi:MAG: ATP-binding protein [Gammaproteobacteria bacterium]|jgi:signal transduction histidine kinase